MSTVARLGGHPYNIALFEGRQLLSMSVVVLRLDIFPFIEFLADCFDDLRLQ